MPLVKSKSPEAFRKNVKAEIKAGKPVWEIPVEEQDAPATNVPELMGQIDGCQNADDLAEVARVIAGSVGLNEHQTQALRVRFKARKAALKSERGDEESFSRAMDKED